jgi:hypothetical protein
MLYPDDAVGSSAVYTRVRAVRFFFKNSQAAGQRGAAADYIFRRLPRSGDAGKVRGRVGS